MHRGKNIRLTTESLIEWCKRAEHEITRKEKEYREKLLEDVKEALNRGATKPSPCKKSWRNRFGR